MKVRHVLSSGFMVLLVQVRQRSFRQLQSFFAVHLDPVIILEAASSFREGGTVVIEAFFYSQRSHINSLSRYLDYVNTSIVLWNQIQHSIQSQWTYNYKPLLSMRSNRYCPFHNVPISLSSMDWMNAMTRQLRSPSSDYYVKRSQSINYHSDF